MNLSSKIPPKFCCKICNYYTENSKDFKKHTLTKKHISMSEEIDGNIKEIKKSYFVKNSQIFLGIFVSLIY